MKSYDEYPVGEPQPRLSDEDQELLAEMHAKVQQAEREQASRDIAERMGDGEIYGELVLIKPQAFRWVNDDGTEAFMTVDHIIGWQIVEDEPRTLYVSVVGGRDMATTTNDEQIERFIALWEIV